MNDELTPSATEDLTTSDRSDQAAEGRDRTSDRRDRTSEDRDRTSDDRDRTAEERDRTSEGRDRSAEERDRIDGTLEGEAAASTAAGGVERRGATVGRRSSDVSAESGRVKAAADRFQAASDRADSASDREASLAGRRAGARDRTEASDDRDAASEDRYGSARDRKDSSIDELTGAYRRGAGLVELEREMIRAERTKRHFVLAFVDVDGLKATNDSLGHGAGDQLLKHVVESSRAHLRPYDLVVRFGGDEFVFGLPDIALEEATRRFQRIDAHLLTSKRSSITVGLAGLGHGDSLVSLIARADEALYEERLRRTTRTQSAAI